MLQRFYPTIKMESAYDIPYEHYYEQGYRGIIFDIDNTLVFHGAPATERAVELFRHLHEIGFDTCLISNNKKPRVQPFAEYVNSKYIYDAKKPSRKNYLQAMTLMNTANDTTLFVGDQLFTDIYGANRSKIASILVHPLNPKEEIQIVLKRYLEKVVLYFYDRTKKS
ncbi:MAG: YqeG family HAD IIIA-type phosphatase [Lachnospiraceae bacterium]